MRIRSIKPEFWRSEDVVKLNYHDRLLFIGLWNYVEDTGVGPDKPAVIASEIFGMDMEVNLPATDVMQQVREGLAKLARLGLILRYEAGGRHYLQVANFKKHQVVNKPSKPRFPLPDSTPTLFTEDYGSPTGTLPEDYAKEEEEEREVERERKSGPADPPGFLEWYTAYPRKEAKGQARAAYIKALTKTNPQALLEGCKRYAQDASRSKQFTKLPATWLNGECWDDDPLPAKVDREPTRKHQEEW